MPLWHEIAQVKRENSSFLPLFIPGVTPYGTVASQIDLWTSFSLLQRVHLYMCVMFLSLETEVAVSELLRGSFLYLSGIGCLCKSLTASHLTAFQMLCRSGCHHSQGQ